MARNNIKAGSLAQLQRDFAELKTFVCNDLTSRVKWQGRGIKMMMVFSGLTLALIAIVLGLVVQSL